MQSFVAPVLLLAALTFPGMNAEKCGWNETDTITPGIDICKDYLGPCYDGGHGCEGHSGPICASFPEREQQVLCFVCTEGGHYECVSLNEKGCEDEAKSGGMI